MQKHCNKLALACTPATFYGLPIMKLYRLIMHSSIPMCTPHMSDTCLCTIDGVVLVQGTVSAAQSLLHGDD